MNPILVPAVAVLAALFPCRSGVASVPLAPQDAATAGANAPKVAGTDVPAPKRTKYVAPEYPLEAQGLGSRGIVILDLVIDEAGRVSSAEVLRSVPPFDAPALSAARQWEYEVTRVDGRPVKVRLSVPITFALRLPEVTRQPGIPDLRQGASPRFPEDAPARGPVRVVAEVTLESDGQVAEAVIRSGEPPWTQSLLQAVRTWRFTPAADEGVVSFRVEAEFLPAGRGTPAKIQLHLAGLRRSEAIGVASIASPMSKPPEPAPTEVDPKAAPPAPPATEPPPTASPSTSPPSPQPTPPQASEDEVIAAPSLKTVERKEPGSSAVPDVALDPGIPDLVKGRRPVVPPMARISQTNGTVRVRFSVDASGTTLIQELEGPDLLKPAAESVVRSWFFRRVSTERLELVAELTYDGTSAKARVGQTR